MSNFKLLTSSERKQFIQKLRDASVMLGQAANDYEMADRFSTFNNYMESVCKEAGDDSFADGSAAFFLCRQIFGFK